MIPRTIARYGVRTIPGDEKVVVAAFRRGEAIAGPAVAEFENRFATYHGAESAIACSFGRMAFHYILHALDLPPNSEIILPALTFWVVPEMVRRAGLRPVFVDVDPDTFNIDPARIEAAVTERTRAIVPTHLYGQPCAMTEVMRLAKKYELLVIEDCAQAAGARYRGRKVGTFGTASFFSFQMLKGINTYGGGMAMTNDLRLANRVRELAMNEPAPSAADLWKRFALGYVARVGVSPKAFTLWGFPLQGAASFLGEHDLSRHVWEKIRPLDNLPRSYRQRYSNVQALLGLRALEKLEEFNNRSRSHAAHYTQGLANCANVKIPVVLPEAEHVYYQYCIYTTNPALTSKRAIRRGVDIETTHVDVCPKLELFADYAVNCPGAEATEKALQLPVYSRLRAADVERVLRVITHAGDGVDAVRNQPVPAHNDERAVYGAAKRG